MAKKDLKRGIFITLEGPEGCGKSTQSKLLYDYLKEGGYDCIYTHEPGGTKIGEYIRHILLGLKDINVSDLTELLLFESARSQIVKEIIRPALAKRKIIICDRFSDATLSYQGYGGKIPIKAIKIIDCIATGGLEPDLTILLDIDTIAGLKRAKKKGVDRMEAKDIAYHRRVRKGYLKLAKGYPDRIKLIKVKDGIDKIQGLIRRKVELVIRRYKRSG